jgi:CRISPR-associated protein Cmr1
MKLRQPNADPPPRDFSTEPGPGIWRESFEVTTLTPIYGGGVKAGEPDPLMPVRASAIRGQLRFWWRLLKQHHPEKPLTGAALFEAEREIWGGMAESNKDYASKVRVRVHDLKGKRTPIPYREFMSRQGNSDIGYALFPAQDNPDSKIIEAGLGFTLTLEYPAELKVEITEVLSWWSSFGGIGARTRRGLGAIQVKGLAQVTEVSHYGCKLIVRDDLAVPKSVDAWHQAIKLMRNFRQGEKGRNRANQNPPGRSHWPEPESIRAITGRYRIKAGGNISFEPDNPNRRDFPRAAFGLPIIFHFKNIKHDDEKKNLRKDQAFDPDDCELKPTDYDRMASPLILKPVALPNGQFVPMALRLPIDHLTDLRLKLRNAKTKAHLSDLPAGTWWPVDIASRQAAAQLVGPLRNYQGQDALTAFLNYFAKG